VSYIRKLPSGLWQAEVRGRDGRKHTHTDRLKSVVRAWAAEQETAIRQGAFRDPRIGDLRIGEWYRRVAAARATDAATKAKHASLWATHCEPQWASWPMSAVTRMEAQEWVNRLQVTRRARHQGKAVAAGDQDVPAIGAETVRATVYLMSQLYTRAMRETPPLVVVNPFAGLELPAVAPRGVDFLERDEAGALYAAAAQLGAQWRVLAELGTDVGLRPGEIFGLHGHRVDWLRGKIQVIDVMTRTGLRQWPKSRKSHRTVPVPPHVLEGKSALMAGRARDALVFTAPAGGPVTDEHFRDRVWYPAVAAAGILPHLCRTGGNRGGRHEQSAQVGLRGLEPRASSLSGKRSNRLSYNPIKQSLTCGNCPPTHDTA
jgi:integrase